MSLVEVVVRLFPSPIVITLVTASVTISPMAMATSSSISERPRCRTGNGLEKAGLMAASPE